MRKGKARGWQVSLGPVIEAEVVAAFRSGTPAIELAKTYERSSSHIYSVLRRAGLRPSEHWRPGVRRDPELENQIVALYKRGRPGGAKDISRKLDVSYATVLAVLDRHGVVVRRPGIPQRTLDRIAALRESGASQADIAAKTRISQAGVSRVLKKIGFNTGGHRTGPSHGAWKGGRLIIRGYVRVWLPRDHRFFEAMALHDGYCFEHRLVMAETLGRPLLPSESVHHIDGDKLHNEPSNLQLRHANHGKGVVLTCRSCGSHDIEASEV